MSKGLEVLKELKEQSKTHRWLEQQFENEWLEIIEKELKDKEKKDKFAEIVKKTISTDLHFDYEEDTERWYVWIDCEGYQVYIFEGQGKEEYDLLKEVLSND